MLSTHVTRRAAAMALVAGFAMRSKGAVSEETPWPAASIIEPGALAERLKDSGGRGPVVLYAGFPVLYRAGHIPGAVLAGPAGKPDGLELLRRKAGPLPRSAEVIVYCGCCPVAQCPNIRPAYLALKSMGFTRIRVVNMPQNFHTDWVAHGYKTEKTEVSAAS